MVVSIYRDAVCEDGSRRHSGSDFKLWLDLRTAWGQGPTFWFNWSSVGPDGGVFAISTQSV